MNHKVFVGENSLSKLKTILDDYPDAKLFLVTGKTSYSKSGAKKKLTHLLQNHEFYRFIDYSENPKIEEAIQGAKLFLENKCELIISIGGGSAIDTAKSINTIVSNPTINPLDLIKNSKTIKAINIPHIAIPTTVGTGSEATHFAVIYYNGKKHSLAHKRLLPNIAILDSLLTQSLTPKLTASTGLDALCQAIESFWSVNATEESKKYATKALSLLFTNIRQSVNQPNNKNRLDMLLGAYWAGRAINISKTTAPHAFSYYLTSKHGISHGHAVALWMPIFLELNKSKISTVLSNIMETYLSKNYVQGFKKLISDVNLENDLRKIISLKNINFDKMIASVNVERLKNNPIEVKSKEIRNIIFNKQIAQE